MPPEWSWPLPVLTLSILPLPSRASHLMTCMMTFSAFLPLRSKSMIMPHRGSKIERYASITFQQTGYSYSSFYDWETWCSDYRIVSQLLNLCTSYLCASVPLRYWRPCRSKKINYRINEMRTTCWEWTAIQRSVDPRVSTKNVIIPWYRYAKVCFVAVESM